MKKQFAMIGLLVVMTMMTAGTAANAQSLQYKMTAKIPFEFTVANKKLPAGEYSVRRAQQTSGDLVLQIDSKDGRESISRLTIPVNTLEPTNESRLVFHRYGDEYFLFEIWPAGGNTGRELPKSRSERAAEQKFRDSVVGMVNVKAPHAEIVTVVASMQ
jgi:hypothetical protein